MQLYSRAACPQAAETILNLNGSKSFKYAEKISIESIFSDGGLKASRPTVVFSKPQFILKKLKISLDFRVNL